MLFPKLNRLRSQLLEGGLAPRVVDRTILELQEHYVDAQDDALNAGLPASAAAAFARSALGSEETLAAAVLARTELLNWTHRWPRCARCLGSVAFYLILPAVPMVYCIQRGGAIARWGASVSLAMLVTGTMLLIMQSILSGVS